MNIFALDNDPYIAASYHADQHLNKMILESAQILSTIPKIIAPHRFQSRENIGIYKPSHLNHPCTRWAAESPDNEQWLYNLARGLISQRKMRFPERADHASESVIETAHEINKNVNARIGWDWKHTPFACVAGKYSPLPIYTTHSIIDVYRMYYCDKAYFKGYTWTCCPKPEWYIEFLDNMVLTEFTKDNPK